MKCSGVTDDRAHQVPPQPPVPESRVTLIDTRSAFDACSSEWNAIYASDPDASVFLSHSWLSDLYRRRPGGICVLAWTDENGRYGAFLPLRRRARPNRGKRRFDNVIGMAGNDWADHNGVLCLPCHESTALPALAAELSTFSWRRLDLEYLKLSASRLKLLQSAFESSDYRVRTLSMKGDDAASLAVSPVVHLPTSFEWWLQQGIRAGTRQRIRRFRRRLAGETAIRIRRSRAVHRERDLDALHQLWLARWRALKGRQAKRKADTYRAMVSDGLASGHMRLVLMEEGRRVVGIHASYVDPVHRVLSFFVGARDPEFDRLPPGLLLHAHEIEWAIEAGFQRYELLRGNEAYKYSLGATDQVLASLEIRPRSLDPERVFLHPACRDEALATLAREQKSARASTLDRLYGQLLESWPGDHAVLESYEQWLRHQGDVASAEAIRTDLG